jgi:hypothetical protein
MNAEFIFKLGNRKMCKIIPDTSSSFPCYQRSANSKRRKSFVYLEPSITLGIYVLQSLWLSIDPSLHQQACIGHCFLWSTLLRNMSNELWVTGTFPLGHRRRRLKVDFTPYSNAEIEGFK